MLQWHISVTMLLFYSQLFLHHKLKSFAFKRGMLNYFKKQSNSHWSVFEVYGIIKPGKFFQKLSENPSQSKPHKPIGTNLFLLIKASHLIHTGYKLFRYTNPKLKNTVKIT